MRRSTANTGLTLVAVWLGILSLVLLGMALFQEPDDGVWRWGNSVASAVEGALALLGLIGVVALLRRIRRGRAAALPILGLFTLLPGASILDAALAYARHGTAATRNHPLNDVLFNAILCGVSGFASWFIVNRRTWAAHDGASSHHTTDQPD